MPRSIMMSLAAGLLVAWGFVGCQPAGKETQNSSDDLKRAAGTWTLVGGEANGKPLSEQVLKDAKLTIVGDTYTVQLGELGVKKGTQKLDSTKTPKQIDAQDTEGPTVGKNLGIYEFAANGDFRVCFAATGKDRPTAFSSTSENGQFIHVWRQAK